MGLLQGMNDIYKQGVYVSDANNALFEYKIFHHDSKEQDQIIITNLRTGKTYGPFYLGKELGVLKEAEKVLNEFVEANSPNI